MGRGPTNENTNMYFQARKKAATYNERLWSREGAAELLGISVSTLADYELGNTKVVPVDKVVLMADLYNAPELITGYCMRECPVHGFLPLATEEKSLEGIALRLLQNFNEDSLKNMRDSLIEITADGKITKDELPALEKIIEQLEKTAEVIKTNQPLIDEYNRFYFQKRREKYYQQHKKEINYYRKCERELKQHLDKNGKVPTARWKREKEELRTAIEELKADKQPYQDELAFVKKVQTCADIARRDREMAEADTSGRSEEKSEKQTKFPAFHAAQTEDIFEESGKAEQQPVNQQEKKPEKKTSLLRKLDEKKKECAERDAKQQAVKKKRNHEMSL